jgi:hypothetical protein
MDGLYNNELSFLQSIGLRTVLCWDIRQRRFLTLEEGTYRLSRNVSMKLPILMIGFR